MAVLVDITKCIGCEGCSVACKMYNGLDFKAKPRNIKDGRVELDDNRWTVIQEFRPDDKLRFVKKQCLHCLEPACLRLRLLLQGDSEGREDRSRGLLP